MYKIFAIKLPLFISYLFLFLLTLSSNAQAFEGKITFVRETVYDTAYFTYFIKGSKIRIDEMNSQKKVVRFMLIDTKENLSYIVNPSLKIYTPYQTQNISKDQQKDFEIIKTENSKTINNYICYQWKVINKSHNTEVTYWVAKDNFNFFEDLLRALKKSDNCSSYFLKIPDIKGFMPMEYVERTLLRVKLVAFIAIKLENKELKDDLFRIPNNYSSFEQSN